MSEGPVRVSRLTNTGAPEGPVLAVGLLLLKLPLRCSLSRGVGGCVGRGAARRGWEGCMDRSGASELSHHACSRAGPFRASTAMHAQVHAPSDACMRRACSFVVAGDHTWEWVEESAKQAMLQALVDQSFRHLQVCMCAHESWCGHAGRGSASHVQPPSARRWLQGRPSPLCCCRSQSHAPAEHGRGC